MEKLSVFKELASINVSDKTNKKGDLTYLSWCFAWGELLNKYPKSTYKVYERDNINYFTDNRTCWVKVSVTVGEIEHIEMLPVMDFKNKSISFDAVTSVDVNKSIQRALTKAIARHGLGLYIYAGEDLPIDDYINKEYITSDQEEEIEELLLDSKADVAKFLKHMRVSKISEIETSKYDSVIKMLDMKLKRLSDDQ